VLGFWWNDCTTVDLRDRCVSLHPTVVLNAFMRNKRPADDAAGGNSTWLGNEMHVIDAVGTFGRHLWPLVDMGGGGGGQMLLVAGREKVHFHGMPDRINTCLASEIGQSQFRIGRDEENGAILEGQRNTDDDEDDEAYMETCKERHPKSKPHRFDGCAGHDEHTCTIRRKGKRQTNQNEQLGQVNRQQGADMVQAEKRKMSKSLEQRRKESHST